MTIPQKQGLESHAQRVIRLRNEYSYRFRRYEKDAAVWPLLEKLMLLRPSADNSLSDKELEALDRKLEPIRIIAARLRKLPP